MTPDRLPELVVYLCELANGAPGFDRRRLARHLFCCDFAAWAEARRPLTGATYLRHPDGPFVPELDGVVDDLLLQGRIAARRLRHDVREPLVALELADLDRFTAFEVDLARHVSAEVADRADVFERPPFVGMAEARVGDRVPYCTHVLERTAPGPGPEVVAWARAVAP